MALDVLTATQEAFAELSAAPEASPASESHDATPDSTTEQATPAEAPSDTSASPATEGSEDAKATDETSTGPIPLDRHKSILEKTREEYEQKLARFKDIDPDSWRERLAAFEAAERDPLAFHRAFEQMLRSDSRYAHQFTQQVAQAKEQTQTEDVEPAPDILLEDGRLTYSNKQLAAYHDWRERKLIRKFEGDYGPLKQRHEIVQRNEQIHREAASQLHVARKEWEGFSEYESEIADILEKDGRATLQSAYNRVLHSKVTAAKVDKAKIEQETRERLIAEMQGKPRANTEVPNGETGGAAKSFKGKSIYDIVAETSRELSSRS
jgi:hypothetical protein